MSLIKHTACIVSGDQSQTRLHDATKNVPVAAADDDDLSRSLAARVRRLDDGRKDLDTRPQNMAALNYNPDFGNWSWSVK